MSPEHVVVLSILVFLVGVIVGAYFVGPIDEYAYEVKKDVVNEEKKVIGEAKKVEEFVSDNAKATKDQFKKLEKL